MIISLLKEPTFETRVSLLPETAAVFVKKGIEVWVETGAGERAFNTDQAYEQAGCRIKQRTEILQSADIVLVIHPPSLPEILQAGSKVFIGVYQPLYNFPAISEWAMKGVTTF